MPRHAADGEGARVVDVAAAEGSPAIFSVGAIRETGSVPFRPARNSVSLIPSGAKTR